MAGLLLAWGKTTYMADVNGGNGNDFLNFSGGLTTVNGTYINPYTGQSVSVNDTYNLTNLTYDGKNGSDFLVMTAHGDALFATNTLGQASLNSIETLYAGDGGDLIMLAHDSITFGNMTIDGGASGDIIWANAGNDYINARDGNDIADGGNGNDYVDGGNGDDWVSGGYGNDLVLGGVGADTLQYVADSVWGVGATSLNADTGAVFNLAGYNQSFDHFDGGDGQDSLLLTAGDDAIVAGDIASPNHPSASGARVAGVEVIDAGDGNDFINLTGLGSGFGNITAYGGNGHDIIWSSAGNDWLSGAAGNDWLYGGDGDDTLYGGPNGSVPGTQIYTQYSHSFFASILYPVVSEGQAVAPADPAHGIHPDDMSVSYATSVKMTFVGTDAGYRNSLGFYRVNEAGDITDVHMAFVNARATTAGSSYTLELDGQTGSDFGLFIIADGYSVNSGYSGIDFNTGTLAFYYNYGQGDERLAQITDTASNITLVWSDGANVHVINGPAYHTTPRTGDNDINPDDAQHVISGLVDPDNSSVLRVGFEDLPNLGDADYNDVTMDVSVEDRTIATPAFDDNDYLVGGAGNDTIYGGIGNDILAGGTGADHLYGEEGADIFILDVLDGNTDSIYDFNASDNDQINIHDVLQGYDPLASLIDDFVRFTDAGGNTVLEINADGDAGGVFVAAALIIGGVGGASVSDLLASGQLVADQSAVV